MRRPASVLPGSRFQEPQLEASSTSARGCLDRLGPAAPLQRKLPGSLSLPSLPHGLLCSLLGQPHLDHRVQGSEAQAEGQAEDEHVVWQAGQR